MCSPLKLHWVKLLNSRLRGGNTYIEAKLLSFNRNSTDNVIILQKINYDSKKWIFREIHVEVFHQKLTTLTRSIMSLVSCEIYSVSNDVLPTQILGNQLGYRDRKKYDFNWTVLYQCAIVNNAHCTPLSSNYLEHFRSNPYTFLGRLWVYWFF